MAEPSETPGVAWAASVMSLLHPPEPTFMACRVAKGGQHTGAGSGWRGGLWDVVWVIQSAASTKGVAGCFWKALPLAIWTCWFPRTGSLKHVQPSNLKKGLAAVDFLATDAVDFFFKPSG